MSHQEWFETAKAEILARPNAPSREVIDATGSTYNNVCHAIAAGAEEVEWLAQIFVESLFLDLAKGDQLSRLGADRYNVIRKGATSAVVFMVIARPTAAAGAVTVDGGAIIRTDDGVRFRISGDVAFQADALGPGIITAVAVEPGVVGNVAENTIVVWETTPPDATLTVRNDEMAAGGNAEESDEDYRARCRAAFVTARKATLEAIRQGAIAVPEVREASAFEVLDPEGHPAGAVIVTIADEEGHANEAMVNAVNLSQVEYRAAGVGVFPQIASVRFERIRIRIRWRPGQATPANALAARQAVIAVVNRLDPRAAPPGSDCEPQALLTVGLIQAAVRTLPGCVDLDVLEPVGTVVPDSGEIIRTGLAYVEVIP